jgi:hypothetical protein
MSEGNTGDQNTGNWNAGNWNAGSWNTGDQNTGYRNTGDQNTGNRNTGDQNTGDRNTGDRNTGDLNTGYLNTGDRNTGDLNTGNWNTGYFCEQEGPVTFFDLPCDLTREQAIDAIPYIDLPIAAEWIDAASMTDEEKAANPNHVTIGGYLKKRILPIREAFPLLWPTLDIGTKRQFMAMPNFGAAKFERITGVDVTKDSDLFPQAVTPVESPVVRKRIVIDGETFELVPVTA